VSVSFREAGSGAGVVCLHSNASGSGQWRALMDLLAPKFHVLAADSYGAGKSPARPRNTMLRDEVALLEPVFARAGDPFALVGHSYGGAIALVAAAMNPKRVRCMALYEPTLFALVERETPHDVDGIRNAVITSLAALESGDKQAAARAFIDFWMEPGAFDRMPERNRQAIAAAGEDVDEWRKALFGEPTPGEVFRRLGVPVLLLVGKQSPLSSRSVTRLLQRTLPKVEVMELEGCGHMAPVTHPDIVNPPIARFLASNIRGWTGVGGA
jgi:pimeloyl-ACP methyl ester carboxylesterase